MTDELLISPLGGAVKSMGSGGKVCGYLIVFGDETMPDLSAARDYFTLKGTDFDLESGSRPPILYHHGMDPVLKRRKIGRAELEVDNVGVWIEAQLALRDSFEQAIFELAQKGKLSWSSGSVGHLVERKKVKDAHEVTCWPIAEASLTPTPANANPLGQVLPLKSYLEARQRSLTLRQLQAEIMHLRTRQTLRQGQVITGRQPMPVDEYRTLATVLHAQQTLRIGQLLSGD